MKLLTAEIKRNLPELYSGDGIDLGDKTVAVKFFDPCGAGTWYAFEGEETEDGDWYFFGWAEILPGCGEMGYFLLSELEAVRGPLGLGIERDLHLGNPKFRDTRHGEDVV